jgi:Uma2 family endonuclease
MSDNTLQFEWIVTIKGGLDAMFRDDPNVFVAGDLLWYPVEGNNTIRTAPDVMVVFGRPKGYRGSYQQWNEGGIAPSVVFEILSPGNRPYDLVRKSFFYQSYGVREYYMYDPNDCILTGWVRSDEKLQEIPELNGHISPCLGIRFELSDTDLRIIRPDGKPFLTFVELARQQELDEQRADQERERAEAERERAEAERERAEAERERAEAAQRRAERLAAQLRAHGLEPDESQGDDDRQAAL